MKPSREHQPAFAKAWDDYGHAVSFDKLFDMKVRSDGHYIVVAWRTPDGMVDYADLARAGVGAPWEMQNDGHDEITEKQWRKARIRPECDLLDVL